jgi:hypothetical protein
MGPPVQSPNVGGGIRIHTVTPPPTRGSTLAGISEIYYGTANRWRDIYNANRKGVMRPDGSIGTLTSTNVLMTGAQIYVP